MTWFVTIAPLGPGLAAAPSPASAAAAASPASPGAAPGQVLRELPAGTGRLLRVSLAACDRAGCPVDISLLRAGVVLGRAAAPLAHPDAPLSRQHVSRGQGIGDPLEAPDLDAWTSGSGERAVTTTLRPVELKGGTAALLVTQFGGGDPARTAHALFAVGDDGVVRVWEAPEAAQPSAPGGARPAPARRYSTTVIPPARPTEALILFHGVFSRDAASPDALGATVFRWDAARRRLAPGPARGLVHVLSLGDFPTAAEARAARESATDCLQDYWILPGKNAGGKAAFNLTVMTTRKDLLAALASSGRQCAPELRQRLVRLP